MGSRRQKYPISPNATAAGAAVSPARIALSRKVEVIHDAQITALGSAFRHKARVDVHLKDGSVHSETREAPRGSEQSFASADDIVAKFKTLTRAVLPPAQQHALIDAVLGMEKLTDARQLTELLRVA